jgi:chromate reductase
MTKALTILGVSGSLRSGSLNTRLLEAAVERAPTGMTVEVYEGLGELPHYNADLDGECPPPEVVALRERIRRVDGVLIATPEYNYSIPGVLKNAIDWASRPSATSSLRHKPVASMGAATGNFGTVRAQLALRQMWVWIDAVPVVKPELHVFRAASRFDESGRLTDEATGEQLVALLEALRTTIRSQNV